MSEERNIQVRVDPESGCAIATIPDFCASKPAAVSESAVEALCTDAGVVVTDDVRAAIRDLVARFRAAPAAFERVIARPTGPIRGEDGFIEWCEGCDPTVAFKPVRDGDRVNHYAGRTFIRVDAGMHVGTLHQPTSGVDGCDVFGTPQRATPGKPCPLHIDPSLKIDNHGRIIADADGVLSVKDRTLLITKLLEVSEHVDFSTGNIDFDGCIDIREDIRDLFQIKADGNITVGGLIEAATIACKGDLLGHRGMVGRGRGSLAVGGDVEIGFLNAMTGTVGGTLTVRREIIDCDLTVETALNAEPCTLIGGTLDLRGKGVIGAIGSPSDRPTHVILSPDANLFVGKVIHPKVLFQIGSRMYETNRTTKGPVRIVADSGKSLAYRIADGVPRPLDEIARVLIAAA